MKSRIFIFNFIIGLMPTLLFSQESHFIPTKEGTLFVKSHGHGIPVVIINGGPGMNSEGFSGVANWFSQTHQAILFDQRGTGQSKIAKESSSSITMDAMVDDLEIIREYFDFDHWIVFGHSFGGMLASYYTSKYPERVSALILSSSGGIDLKLLSDLNITARLSQEQQDSLTYWNNQISQGDSSHFARLQRGRFLAPAYLYDQTHVPVIAQRLTQGNQKINRMVWQNLRAIQFDCAKQLASYSSPVLIIQGKNDVLDLSIAQHAHDVFPSSSLILLDQCGHYGWLDRPEQYWLAIKDFLQELPPAP